MSLLAIPLKGTGEVDLIGPIKSVISSQRSPSTSDMNSLTELQSLRNRMVLNVKNKNYSETAQKDLENYFDQLGENNDNVINFQFNKINCFFRKSGGENSLQPS